MRNYVIEIKDELLNPIVTDSIEAENADHAYEKFIYKMRCEHKDIPFRNVYIKGGIFEENHFEPPHYDGHKEKPTIASTESNDQVNQATSNVGKIQEFISLLNHRNYLRENTAYPALRIINLINSIAIVLSCMILGGDIGHDEGIVIGGIAGVIVAILNYSLTSVFFDVADSNINTSRNSQGKSQQQLNLQLLTGKLGW